MKPLHAGWLVELRSNSYEEDKEGQSSDSEWEYERSAFDIYNE